MSHEQKNDIELELAFIAAYEALTIIIMSFEYGVLEQDQIDEFKRDELQGLTNKYNEIKSFRTQSQDIIN